MPAIIKITCEKEILKCSSELKKHFPLYSFKGGRQINRNSFKLNYIKLNWYNYCNHDVMLCFKYPPYLKYPAKRRHIFTLSINPG